MSRELVFAERPKTRPVGRHLPHVVELTKSIDTVDGIRVRRGAMVSPQDHGNNSHPGEQGERYRYQLYPSPAVTDWVLVDRSEANWPSWVRWRGPASRVGYSSEEEAHDRMRQILHRCAAAGFGPDLSVRKRVSGIMLEAE